MRKFRTSFLFLIPLFTFSYIGCSNNKTATRSESNLPARTEVIEIIQKVNGNWQASHPNHENSFWHRAAYHTGNMAAYEVTKIENYKAYSEAWAEHNLWMGAQSNDTSKWKYSYGESDEYVLFGDFQTCFQVYIDLYNLNPDEKKIARAKQVMEYQMSTPNNDYWWWADGLYMAMPVMTKLYKLTDNELYLDKLYEYFSFARDLMYDSESKLFYRDAKYIYPKHKTDNGLKDFWARGNGWVFAAMPKTLENLPETNAHRAEYIKIYQDMAIAIADSQQEDGSWTRSMLDPQHAPGPETSGTAFFTYGFLWGINNGILDKATYLPVVEKSWKYLSETALQPDGKIGYVQPIGEKAIPGQVVDVNSTADFGVGAFLLAASELVKYLDKQQ
ncbi:glycoside hydrolase family 88 protein [Dysgonomonas sp. HDW5A]|uniref:glycoside hydrolase family 88/105 protein n=1 Tax=Dysgonomonas sp. HDW5A TaxID=2714926 RepID=UPI00140B92F5|nr:glycoside hydrolase family 88 protein [Dysgonomonas sp. HDW5A]QIK59151.1 glycoside hydrolase family 88 protein [Dysgonomonas sp. HDW5A]